MAPTVAAASPAGGEGLRAHVTSAMDLDPQHPSRSRLAFGVVLATLALACAGFTALGLWQVQRLHWKHALIARVDARVHAAPVALPGAAQWQQMDQDRAEYLRVRASGRYLAGRDTRVQALTELGAGAWILTPLRTDAGETVLVNRGFVADGERAAPPPSGEVRVTGLVRMDEPDGRVLRPNLPAQDRWFSRDTAAIAARRGLGPAAPFFIDAAYDPTAPPWPRGGMTVTRFRDHHLQYALTWFALALMSAGAAAWLFINEGARKRRRP